VKIIITMPAYNEEEGLPVFVSEIASCLHNYDLHFIVIDDKSSDHTLKVLGDIQQTGLNLIAVSNRVNRGHGPSTMIGMKLAIAEGADVIITTDGDGQFVGIDFQKVLDTLLDGNFEIVEGVRTERFDPLYRKFVSAFTRLLVFRRSRKRPQDANTPLRAYRPEILERLLTDIPENSAIPNLHISALTRTSNLSIAEVPVRSIARRGSVKSGSTWGNRREYIPTRRFIRFCKSAVSEWVSASRKVV
jgi:dolichol-phosphate mannosyltransferase